jgi:transposase
MPTIDRTDAPAVDEYATVHVAFELSKAKWQVGVLLPGSQKLSRYRIAGGDVAALAELLDKATAKAARAGRPVAVVSCYEAGFDGHWLDRWLGERGVVNHVLDPASLPVSRRARRAKTDPSTSTS